ncbi:ABC transporter permease [Bacillus songklensis]|uniref:ABC transporter permease n=1 Tax=Bacillus songklensis TaxID=1069116 RepID=A0ABV8BAX0_9BACI
MRNTLHAEWRTTLRQPSSYTFVVLWSIVLSILFMLGRSMPDFNGYTNMTGTIANLLLYLVPLFMLIIGSFSIASEMENGQWQLLSTYPISTFKYVLGKYVGQLIAQCAIFTLSFGIGMGITLISQSALSVKWLLLVYVFSILLIVFFLVIGMLIGVFVSNRWQALMFSIGVWFFLIMMWASVLIGLLGFFPYPMIGRLLKLSLLINPAELLRVMFVVQLGGGAVFGQPFDALVNFLKIKISWGVIGVYTLVYLAFSLTLASWNLERRKFQ